MASGGSAGLVGGGEAAEQSPQSIESVREGGSGTSRPHSRTTSCPKSCSILHKNCLEQLRVFRGCIRPEFYPGTLRTVTDRKVKDLKAPYLSQ